MRLTFIYTPVRDLEEALAFYRDTLGWSEAWREGETTAAFQLPDSDVQVMIDAEGFDDRPAPMFGVDSVADFLASKPGLKIRHEPKDIPGGQVAGFEDPAGNLIYLIDQSTADAAQ